MNCRPAPGTVTLSGPTVLSKEGKPLIEPRTIRIIDGTIAAVETCSASDFSFDSDCLILPGFVDLHVHCREDPTGKHAHKEDFESAGLSALRGGVTAITDMPNNPLPPIDRRSYEAKKKLTERCPVEVLLYGLLDPGKGPFSTEIPYKLYLEQTGLSGSGPLSELFRRFKGCFLAVHPEDPEVLRRASGASTHEARRPPEAEIRAVRSIIEALRENPVVHVHLCHLSLRESAEILRQAKEEELPVSAEVCLHHLIFSCETFPGELKAFRAVNPPLRTEDDRRALLEALSCGVIDALATDHAPHKPEEKKQGAPGFPGLEVYGLCFTELVKEIPLARLVEAAGGFPGEVWQRFTGRKRGVIEPGAVGSLTVLRPTVAGGVRPDPPVSKCGWSPYQGRSFPGCVEATVVLGNLAFHR